jgi:hypothetical protein
MKLLPLIMAIYTLLIPTIVVCQPNNSNSETLKLNGIVADKDSKGISDIEIILQVRYKNTMEWIKPPTGKKVTNNSGYFQFIIPRELLKNINKIKFTIENNNWKIIFPKNGEDDPKGEVTDGVLYTYEIVSEIIPQTSTKDRLQNLELKTKIKSLEENKSLLENRLAALVKEKNSNGILISDFNNKLIETKKILLEQQSIRDSLKIKLQYSIFSSLNKYVDDLKNLDQLINRQNIRDAFIFPGTRDELAKRRDNYNESRETLTKVKDAYLIQVGNTWEPKQQNLLSIVYNFILQDIHLNILATSFNTRIVDNIDAFTKQRKPRLVVQPKAVKAAEEIDMLLNYKIASLEEKIQLLRVELN